MNNNRRDVKILHNTSRLANIINDDILIKIVLCQKISTITDLGNSQPISYNMLLHPSAAFLNRFNT